MPLFSVIISGYKETALTTLAACLRLQPPVNGAVEILFLDNTRDSRHRTAVERLFAEEPGEAVRRLYLPVTVPGKVPAQNEGIRQARGEVLVFLDDDVLPDPDLLQQYDRAFAAYACGAVQGRVELMFTDPSAVPTWLNARFRLDLAEMDFGRAIHPFTMGLTGANMAFRSAMFEKYGLFDERLGPARSGTLEDQEFSERIQRGGETQLFWPDAHVRHVIPPERLRVRSFCRIYYDVGFSDYFLSRDLIRGGRVKFTLYQARRAAAHALAGLGRGLRGDRAGAILGLCESCRDYAYWKQAVRQWGGGEEPKANSQENGTLNIEQGTLNFELGEGRISNIEHGMTKGEGERRERNAEHPTRNSERRTGRRGEKIQ